MRFAFTKEEDDFRQEVREFLKNELPKNWDGVGLIQARITRVFPGHSIRFV